VQQRGNDRTLAMSFDPTVKDEAILAGFSSLHGAMAEGFDRMSRMFERQFETNGRRFEVIDRRFEAIELRFQDVERQILDLRNDVARLKHECCGASTRSTPDSTNANCA
jgi:hypothetical protein